MKKNTIAICTAAVFISMFIANIPAQVVLSGTNYFETFDFLGAGLPSGWSVRTGATATASGNVVSFTTNATSWANTAGQFANYASTVNNGTNFIGLESSSVQSSCTNRSLGVRLTGAFGDPGAAFVFQLQNTLNYRQLQLSIDLDILNVQGRSNTWVIDYGIGSPPTAFIPVWTNSDTGVFGTTTRTISFGSALDNQVQPVWIRIVAIEPSTGFGSRDTFGLDNFKLTYASENPVSPIPLNIQLIGTNAILTWTNPVFVLQAASDATGAYSNLVGATSPYTNSIIGSQKYFRLKAN